MNVNHRSCLPCFIFAALLLVGCNHSGGNGTARIAALQKAIHPGMPRSQVEPKLLASGLEYGWNADQNAFYVIARDVNIKNFVHEDRQLVISMTPDGRVSRVQMKRLYTGP